MQLSSAFSDLSRPQKWTIYAAGAVILYTILGFLVAPPILRSQAEGALAEQLGRRVTIGEVALNPFALSLTVRGFELNDADQSAFVEFDELYVNFQLSSIFHRAFALSEARVEAPFVHVKVLQNGLLNFADILERLEGEEKLDDGEPSGLPALLVHVAKVSQGRILFSDYSHPTPFEHEISPLDVELRDFGTRPDDESPYSFSATTGAGEALKWEGSLSVVPLHSSGQFTLTGVRPRTGWLYFQDDLTFEVVDGSVDIRGRYEVDAREGLSARLEEGIIQVRDFAVAERESGQRAVEIPEFDIEGIALEYPELSLRVARVSSQRGRLHLQRMANGRFRVERFLESRRKAAVEEQVDVTADVASASPVAGGGVAGTASDLEEAAWSVTVDEVEIAGFRVEYEDLSSPEPVRLKLDPITLVVRELTTEPGRPAHLDLDVTLQQTGQIGVAGRVGANPPFAELDLEGADIDLRLFEPYWSELAAVQMQSGFFGLSGHVVAKDLDGPSRELAFDGDLGITKLQTRDRSAGQELVSWKAVELEGLSVRVDPTSVHLRRLGLVEPSVQILVDRDGGSNLQRIVIAPPEDAPETVVSEGDAVASQEDAVAPVEEVAVEPPADVPVRIDVVEVEGASARFVDRSVEPSFSSKLTDLGGRIEGLSSDPASRSKVRLEGKLNGATPMRISGVVSPLASEVYADFQVHFANFELTPFTPYSGRFIGKAIERGKLFVDLDYELDGNVLAGQNKIFLDQFTLGEDVASPDALDLPVGLAIGLMKDRKGEIHIDLPVRGAVDDPEFSVGGLIASALRNLITKAALSPFSLIGGLVGQDGEAMRFVEFEPGSEEIPPAEMAKLEALVSALAERPGLSLELSGAASETLDRPVLQAAALDARIREARFAELQKKWFGEKPQGIEDIALTPEDSTRLLKSAYRDQFGEDPKSLLGPATLPAVSAEKSEEPMDAYEERMLRSLRGRMEAEMPIDDTELRELAGRRAQLIRDALVADGRVSPERVFLLEPTLEDQTDAAGARSVMSLAAR